MNPIERKVRTRLINEAIERVGTLMIEELVKAELSGKA
jgi:hypothetical protein